MFCYRIVILFQPIKRLNVLLGRFRFVPSIIGGYVVAIRNRSSFALPALGTKFC